jgi:hypothetical protein
MIGGMSQGKGASMEVQAQGVARRAGQEWRQAEQMLFDTSPVGLTTTSLVLFAVLVGGFAIVAWIDHAPWIIRGAGGAPEVDRRAWVSVCLALTIASALGLQRYSWVMDHRDLPAFARAVDGEVVWARFSKSRLRLFTAIGVVVGALGMLWLARNGASGPAGPAVTVWFGVLGAVVGAMFFRGLELTGSGQRHARRVLSTGLKVDLLRVEQLYPFGRSAARTALVWFTVSAEMLLLFSGELGAYTIVLGAVCAAIGAWVFLSTLSQAHHEIRKAKAAELEVARVQIDALRRAIDHDPGAAARLQGMLAYEARIDAAPEWPFDQTILVRVGASALILTVPWFGQAFASLVVDHFGKLIP